MIGGSGAPLASSPQQHGGGSGGLGNHLTSNGPPTPSSGVGGGGSSLIDLKGPNSNNMVNTNGSLLPSGMESFLNDPGQDSKLLFNSFDS